MRTFPENRSVLPPLVEHHLHHYLAADRLYPMVLIKLPFMSGNGSVRGGVERSGEAITEELGGKRQMDGHRCRVR